MRLLSLELKNIRSYRNATIAFPDGITLLSGDIGAGKSTLLLAIEFALFGINRGELVGSALLRHGAADGAVTLSFETPSGTYRVTRTLRRSATGVSQDAGWIETELAREALTPSELRARIFEILGYPLQFLSKQKNLLYRFTLYTPQEEMKSILTQTSDERLETIRRIFGIDAYRIARDNAQLLAKAIKDREALHEAVLPRIEQERVILLQKLARQDQLTKDKLMLATEREKLLGMTREIESAVAALEQERMQLQQEQQAQAMQERNRKIAQQELAQLQSYLAQKERVKQNTLALLLKLRTAREQFTQELAQANATDAATLEQDITAAQQLLETLRQDEGKAALLFEQAKAPNVTGGVDCPLCRQPVSQEYISNISAVMTAQREAAKRRKETLERKAALQRELLLRLRGQLERRKQLDDISRQVRAQEELTVQHDEELLALSAAIAAKQANIAPASADAATSAAMLAQRVMRAQQQSVERNAQLGKHRAMMLDLEKRLGRIEQEEQDLATSRERLVLLEHELLGRQAELASDARARNWVSRQFTPFAANVERHVLTSIHTSFDAVFRQWFSRLVEDDALSTRIDHAFAPIMLQHGYETDVAYLSGGERTAVSLAYRLALVHTIHALLPNLATAGLIMLDEPTDGFSSEQLERVRDVLREISVGQIILVSHEQQLEGFVDHILRVRKTGDGSIVEIAA